MRRLVILGLVAAGLLSGACGGGEEKPKEAAGLSYAEMKVKAGAACGADPLSLRTWPAERGVETPEGTEWFTSMGKVGSPDHIVYVTPAGETSECITSCQWLYRDRPAQAKESCSS